MNEYNIIVACDKNNGIGKNNKLPWYKKEDILYFYHITKGENNNCIIMGRKTRDSLPKFPLPYRDNYVLSKVLKGDKIFNDLRFMNQYLNSKNYKERWVIGGESIYKEFLNNKDVHIKYIHISIINNHYDCDTFFPKISENYVLIEKKIISDEITIHIFQNKDCF